MDYSLICDRYNELSERKLFSFHVHTHRAPYFMLYEKGTCLGFASTEFSNRVSAMSLKEPFVENVEFHFRHSEISPIHEEIRCQYIKSMMSKLNREYSDYIGNLYMFDRIGNTQRTGAMKVYASMILIPKEEEPRVIQGSSYDSTFTYIKGCKESAELLAEMYSAYIEDMFKTPISIGKLKKIIEKI